MYEDLEIKQHCLPVGYVSAPSHSRFREQPLTMEKPKISVLPVNCPTIPATSDLVPCAEKSGSKENPKAKVGTSSMEARGVG